MLPGASPRMTGAGISAEDRKAGGRTEQVEKAMGNVAI